MSIELHYILFHFATLFHLKILTFIFCLKKAKEVNYAKHLLENYIT